MPPKSILKKSSSFKTPPSPPAAEPEPERDPTQERNLKVALHHANLIQQQKDFESAILDAIITLLDYPPSSPLSPADPASPSPAAARTFTTLVSIFQPHDYDNLLTERQVAGRCAYALCPRSPVRNDHSKGKLRLMDDSKGRIKAVPRQAVELWCSKECAKRALYVKVQLLEEPGWLRRGGDVAKVDLLPENTAISQSGSEAERQQQNIAQFTLPVRPKDKAQDDGLTKAMKDLALERGEEGTSFNATELVSKNIREKRAMKVPEAPSFQDSNGNMSHVSVEGYNPKGVDPKQNPVMLGKIDN